MDKKFKFSEQPISAKITYVVVVAMLLISAIVVGIVSAAQAKKDELPDENNPSIEDENSGNENNGDENNDSGNEDNGNEDDGGEANNGNLQEPTVYYSPVLSGSIMKSHSTTTPVFSQTLGDWRVHTGIDISAEIGTDVLAVATGTVTNIRTDRFLGKTVEITHDGGMVVSVYSNLSNDGIVVSVGDNVKAGDKIGVVGDTSLTELADESHLHFEIVVSGASVNPLDYIEPQSQKNSLGVK